MNHPDIRAFFQYFQDKDVLKDRKEDLQSTFRRSMVEIIRKNADLMPFFSLSSSIFARTRGGWVRRARRLGRSNFYGVLSMLRFQKLSKNSLNWGYAGNRGKRFEQGSETIVTPAMRRLFGLQSKESANPQPGINFFPLRKNTQVLRQPPRPFLTLLSRSPEFYDAIKKMVGEYYTQ